MEDQIISPPPVTSASIAANQTQHLNKDVQKKKKEPVYLGSEVTDDDVMQQSLERIPMTTNLFYADQHEKMLEQDPNSHKGFLFVQSEQPVSHFRWVLGGPDDLDRSFLAYFMTKKEFLEDVVKEHPLEALKEKSFKRQFSALIDAANPYQDIVTLGIFGDGQISLFKTDIPDYSTLLDGLKEQPGMFDEGGAVLINIDRT